jgi:hypothetical protein
MYTVAWARFSKACRDKIKEAHNNTTEELCGLQVLTYRVVHIVREASFTISRSS